MLVRTLGTALVGSLVLVGLAPVASAENGGRDLTDCWTAELAQIPGDYLDMVLGGLITDLDFSTGGWHFIIPTPIELDHGWLSVVGYVDCAVASLGDLVDCVSKSILAAEVAECIL